MERWRGKVAVVTGASAGIGLAIVKALLNEGMTVVGLARRKNKMLEEIQDDKFVALGCDIANEHDVIKAFDHIKTSLKTVHILINNAGIVKSKTIEETPTDELQSVINTNIMGVVHCYKQAVKLMKENGEEAYIVNINSIAGHKIPFVPTSDGKFKSFNIYPPTKFALKALSEIMSRDLLGNKIRVTNLSPGYVKTGLMTEQMMKESNLTNELPALEADDIADAIVYLIGTPLRVQVTEFKIQPLGEIF